MSICTYFHILCTHASVSSDSIRELLGSNSTCIYKFESITLHKAPWIFTHQSCTVWLGNRPDILFGNRWDINNKLMLCKNNPQLGRVVTWILGNYQLSVPDHKAGLQPQPDPLTRCMTPLGGSRKEDEFPCLGRKKPSDVFLPWLRQLQAPPAWPDLRQTAWLPWGCPGKQPRSHVLPWGKQPAEGEGLAEFGAAVKGRPFFPLQSSSIYPKVSLG